MANNRKITVTNVYHPSRVEHNDDVTNNDDVIGDIINATPAAASAWRRMTPSQMSDAAANYMDDNNNHFLKLYRDLLKYQHAVVLGDIIACRSFFGATSTDRRSDALKNLMEQQRFIALRTYIHRTCVLIHLDIAAASDDIAHVCNWFITDDQHD